MINIDYKETFKKILEIRGCFYVKKLHKISQIIIKINKKSINTVKMAENIAKTIHMRACRIKIQTAILFNLLSI